jgi:hypothetical protein
MIEEGISGMHVYDIGLQSAPNWSAVIEQFPHQIALDKSACR